MRTSTTLLYILLFLFPLAILGQTHTWTGNGGDTDWFNASNWNANSVPDATSDVLIPSGFVVDITTSGAALDLMTIEANATLEVNNSITITTGIEIQTDGYVLFTLGTLSGNATITNHGTFEITGTTQKIISELVINNENLLFINNTGIIRAWDNMVLNNAQGATVLSSGGSGALSTDATGGTFNNYGLLYKEDIGQFGSFYLSLDTNNYGTLWVGKTQTILILSPQNSINNTATGIMAGEGTFDITAPFTNNGIIRPDGSQTVELTFLNNFQVSPTSIIELDISGTMTDDHDRLKIFGDPFVEGIIDINLLYDANLGDEYIIFTATQGLSCNLPATLFAEYNGYMYELEVICNSNDITLKVIDKELILNIEAFETISTKVAPNPTDGVFELHFGKTLDEVVIHLSDIQGRRISSNTFRNQDKCTLEIKGSSGLYFANAITPEGDTKTFKVIKQ